VLFSKSLNSLVPLPYPFVTHTHNTIEFQHTEGDY